MQIRGKVLLLRLISYVYST